MSEWSDILRGWQFGLIFSRPEQVRSRRVGQAFTLAPIPGVGLAGSFTHRTQSQLRVRREILIFEL